LGAPSGARFGVNGPQSGVDWRTSSAILPLKPAGSAGVAKPPVVPPALLTFEVQPTSDADNAAARSGTRMTRALVPMGASRARVRAYRGPGEAGGISRRACGAG
jgi:hypothetical protein